MNAARADVGQSFDQTSYVEANTGGGTRWSQQELGDPEVVVVGDTAVLRATVTDEVDRGEGPEAFRMPIDGLRVGPAPRIWSRSAYGRSRGGQPDSASSGRPSPPASDGRRRA